MRDLLNMPEAGLLKAANALRQKAFGNFVELCAIINIRSGNCSMDCKFCAQSSHSPGASPVYDLLADEELERRVLALSAWPVAHIGLVTSGARLSGAELTRLCRFVDSLPEHIRGKICISPGRLPRGDMRELRACGIRRYHHNLETSKKFYPRICGTQTWQSRFETLERAAKEGFEVCSGALFGIGESWEDRYAIAESLAALGIKYIPVNFLNPRPRTPLADRQPLAPGEALRIVAILRHILPEATLRICGGRGFTLGERQRDLFSAGANALMTGDYLTTKGASLEADLAMLAELGLEVAAS